MYSNIHSPFLHFLQITTTVNRSRLDEAAIIFYMYDDSPRNGYNYHGMNSEVIFKGDDGSTEKHDIPLGLEVLPDGKHIHQVQAGVKVLGKNIVKVPSTMSDNAARDVGSAIFSHKEVAVELLKAQMTNFSDEELEVMSTNFVDTCITHCGDLASKKHFGSIAKGLEKVVIIYNCATLIQSFMALRRGRKLKSVFIKLFQGKVGKARYHTPMKLVSQTTNAGKQAKQWSLTEDVSNVWSLMCSMSNLISHQGKHSVYYLNESKALRLFWVR